MLRYAVLINEDIQVCYTYLEKIIRPRSRYRSPCISLYTVAGTSLCCDDARVHDSAEYAVPLFYKLVFTDAHVQTTHKVQPR